MINWQTKTGGRYGKCHPRTDVVISRIKDKRNSISFRFVKDSAELITKTEYIVYGQEGSKIYFKEADKRSGWKLCSWFNHKSQSKNCFFKVDPRNINVKENQFGEYVIDLDAKTGLCFIDLNCPVTDDSVAFVYKRR